MTNPLFISFEGPDGSATLADLFDGKRQLIVYHFMFGPGWKEGCPHCSFWADNFNGLGIHLRHRDTTMVAISRAPFKKLEAFKKRMGWGLNWVSTAGNDFHRDLGFARTKEELAPFLDGEIPPTVEQNARMCGTDAAGYVAEGPGLSAYVLSHGTVYRTYVTTARGLEPVMGYYGLLDRTAAGRDESGSQPHWLRRHDEY